MRNLFTRLLSVTGRRYQPEITWSKDLWTHNFFRAFEYLFGRRFGIRQEATACYGKVDGEEVVIYRFYTVEALLAHVEGMVRNYLKSWKLGFKFVPVPQFATTVGNFPLFPRIFSFAIAFVEEGQEYVGSTVTVADFTLTVSGTDTFMYGGTWDQTVSQTSTATYNGDAMTAVTNFTPAGLGPFRSYAFYQINPDAGANTAAATRSAGVADYYFFASFYTGVKQSAQPDNFVTNESLATVTSLTFTLTTVADNCWTAVVGASNWGGLAAGTGSTLRGTVINGFGGYFDSNAAITPAGSTTMTINCSTGTSTFWGPGGIMTSFAPSTGVAGTSHYLNLLRVGT